MNKEASLDHLERAKERQTDESLHGYLIHRMLGVDNISCHRQLARRQYLNICPNSTVYDQELPDCLKRFSLSGRVYLEHDCPNLLVFDWIRSQ